MSRRQALLIGILAGVVVLVFGFLAAVLFIEPVNRLFFTTPTPTITLTPTVSPTSTLPNFLPTPSSEPPTPAEPTPTNTRLPTPTPRPTNTPRPTVVFVLTLPARPTDTPTPPPTLPPAVISSPRPGDPTRPPQIQYDIDFRSDGSRLDEGQCANLRWQVIGATNVRLDGDPVPLSGSRRVCPNDDTTYQLTAQLPDGNQASREVEITVRPADDDDDLLSLDDDDG